MHLIKDHIYDDVDLKNVEKLIYDGKLFIKLHNDALSIYFDARNRIEYILYMYNPKIDLGFTINGRYSSLMVYKNNELPDPYEKYPFDFDWKFPTTSEALTDCLHEKIAKFMKDRLIFDIE